MNNRWFPGNKGYDSRYFLSKVIVFLASLFLCALFAVVKPVEVKAGTHGDVRTSQFTTGEDVQIDGNANIIIDSDKTIDTLKMEAMASDITVTITGDADHTLECEQIALSPGQGTLDNNVLIIDSGNLKVKNRIEVTDIVINGGTIETESDVLNAILAFNNIVINGGTIEAHSNGLMAIHSYKSITINGGNVKVTASRNAGIVGGEGVTITGGIVEAAGETGGIYADGGNIIISGDNTIVKEKILRRTIML
jgi:hypothetical protein